MRGRSSSCLEKQAVKGMANITGGGPDGKHSPRDPEGASGGDRAGAWKIPPDIEFLKTRAGRPRGRDVPRVSSMGVGRWLCRDGDGVAVLKNLQKGGKSGPRRPKVVKGTGEGHKFWKPENRSSFRPADR